MSASAFPKDPQNHVIPLHAGSNFSNHTNDSFEQLPPSLPHVGIELERYFTIAKQIEAKLTHQKQISKRYEEELKNLQSQYSRLVSDSDSQMKDSILREERLKLQLNTQLQTYQQNEKILQNQIADLARQIEKDQENKRKSEVDLELLRANLDYMKQRESSLTQMIKTFQTNEQSHSKRIHQLTQQLNQLKVELQRYRSSWNQVILNDQKARSILQEYQNLKSDEEELRLALEEEKRRNQNMEELVNKERRDKRSALTQLHVAEARLNQTLWELENLKKQTEPKTLETGFELKL